MLHTRLLGLTCLTVTLVFVDYIWGVTIVHNEATFKRLSLLDDYVRCHHKVQTVEKVTSIGLCATVCLADETCDSFFKFEIDGVSRCQLHSILFTSREDGYFLPGASYWQLTQERNCPHKENYVVHRSPPMCYAFHNVDLSWGQAYASCHSRGSHLLELHYLKPYKHFLNFMTSSSAKREENVTIGGVFNYPYWVWNSSGLEMLWTSWAGRKAYSLGDQGCLQMIFQPHDGFAKMSCTTIFQKYVCQKDFPLD